MGINSIQAIFLKKVDTFEVLLMNQTARKIVIIHEWIGKPLN